MSDHTSPAVVSQHTRRVNRIIAVCLVLMAACMLGLMIMAGMQVDGVLRDFRHRHVAAGYTELDAREVVLEAAVTEPTLIYAQHVALAAGSTAPLAIYGGDAVIEGTVQGDLAFLGGSLDIAPGAVIEGDLHLDVAKHVTLRGRVTGEIRGGADRMYGDPSIDQDE